MSRAFPTQPPGAPKGTPIANMRTHLYLGAPDDAGRRAMTFHFFRHDKKMKKKIDCGTLEVVLDKYASFMVGELSVKFVTTFNLPVAMD